MSTVAPDDLANLCAALASLKSPRFSEDEVRRIAQRSLRLDTATSPDKIISAAIELGLVAPDAGGHALTKVGRELGRAQREVAPGISSKASAVLVKRVYLNLSAGQACCADFLLRFKPDGELGTLVYHRPSQETQQDLSRTQTLQRVGLFEVSGPRIAVVRSYIPAVNELLRQVRRVPAQARTREAALRRAIGDVAEELAVSYEETRLARNGHEDLAPFVHRISTIDPSAGYDILSFRGTGKEPGRRILIEAKGTSKSRVQFIWTENEREVAQESGARYWIYCYTDVDWRKRTGKGPFRIKNPASRVRPPEYQVKSVDVFVQRRR